MCTGNTRYKMCWKDWKERKIRDQFPTKTPLLLVPAPAPAMKLLD